MEAERLEAERQAKLEKQWDDADRAQFGRDVAAVAATEPGRRLLAWIVAGPCRFYSETPAGDPEFCGRRAAGLELMRRVDDAAPGALLKAQCERYEVLKARRKTLRQIGKNNEEGTP